MAQIEKHVGDFPDLCEDLRVEIACARKNLLHTPADGDSGQLFERLLKRGNACFSIRIVDHIRTRGMGLRLTMR